MPNLPDNLPDQLKSKYSVAHSNTLYRQVKDNPKDKIQIEIGDAKQPDFKPQFKLMRWDNEVNFSMRAEEHPSGKVKTEGEKIIYETPNYEVHQYDKPDAGEDGGFEFEWVLKKKPVSNVLTTTIQTKGLNFFYQPALTQEEIDEGASRPENVIGSYAVYHATKGGMNKADGMEYKVGKAFHIYRPKVTDANGSEVWGELNIDEQNGKLTVTIDQTWLDNAVYPVIVDPTFGFTSAGGTEASIENAIWKGRYAISEDGNGDSLTMFLNCTIISKSAQCNIYADESGEADNSTALIANGITEEKTISTGSGQEITFNFSSSPSFSNGTVYRLAGWGSSGSGSLRMLYDTAQAGNYAYIDGNTWGSGWPDPSADTNLLDDYKLSIYATYTAGGGSVVQDIISPGIIPFAR